jgi:hypothetical protein
MTNNKTKLSIYIKKNTIFTYENDVLRIKNKILTAYYYPKIALYAKK